MSMPQFPPTDNILSRDEAINAILTSIALEEAALSHIINAEGEKIQYALKHLSPDDCCKSMCWIVKVNDSVSALVDQITDLQLLLKSKMRIAASLVLEGNDDDLCTPPPPPPSKPPTNHCKTVKSERTQCL